MFLNIKLIQIQTLYFGICKEYIRRRNYRADKHQRSLFINHRKPCHEDNHTISTDTDQGSVKLIVVGLRQQLQHLS